MFTCVTFKIIKILNMLDNKTFSKNYCNNKPQNNFS